MRILAPSSTISFFYVSECANLVFQVFLHIFCSNRDPTKQEGKKRRNIAKINRMHQVTGHHIAYADMLGIRLPIDFVNFYQIAQSTSGTESYSEGFTLIASILHKIVSSTVSERT